MEYFYLSYCSEEIEFYYDGKTDQDALAQITEDSKITTLRNQTDSFNKLQHSFFRRKDTKLPVSTINPRPDHEVVHDSEFFTSIVKFFWDKDGSLWGISNTLVNGYGHRYYFARLITSDGKRDLMIPDAFADGIKGLVRNAKVTEDYIYYNVIDTETFLFDWWKKPQKIFRVGLSGTKAAEDLFKNVPGDICQVSFSLSQDFLYFTGLQGTAVLNGKINLNTLEYTKIDLGGGVQVTGMTAFH